MILNFRMLLITVIAIGLLQKAYGDTTWSWSYAGNNIHASGTFIVDDATNSLGFHEIKAISGSRNNAQIVKLYDSGKAIPGNEPYLVDNLIRLSGNGQLNIHGVGFLMSSGEYINIFFDEYTPSSSYKEVLTTPATFIEMPISFHAKIIR